MFSGRTPVSASKLFFVSFISDMSGVRLVFPDSASGAPTAAVIEMPRRPQSFGSTAIPMTAEGSAALALKQDALNRAEKIATVQRITCNLERLMRFRLSMNVASQRPAATPNSARLTATVASVTSQVPSSCVGAQCTLMAKVASKTRQPITPGAPLRAPTSLPNGRCGSGGAAGWKVSSGARGAPVNASDVSDPDMAAGDGVGLVADPDGAGVAAVPAGAEAMLAAVAGFLPWTAPKIFPNAFNSCCSILNEFCRLTAC